jgi:hypothetical protein
MPKTNVTIGHRMSCGEPDAQEWASPVRRAGRGNGPAVTPAPRPGPTLPAPRGAMRKEMTDINISSVPAGMPAPG